MSSAAKTAADLLFAIAEEQQGYFTSKQAADAGYQLGSQAVECRLAPNIEELVDVGAQFFSRLSL